MEEVENANGFPVAAAVSRLLLDCSDSEWMRLGGLLFGWRRQQLVIRDVAA